MGYWRGYLPGVWCKWFAYGPAEATATHYLLLQQNPEWFTFLVPAYPGCPGKKAINVCVCVCVVVCVCVDNEFMLRPSDMVWVDKGSHSCTCHPQVPSTMESAVPVSTPKHIITALWPVLIWNLTEDRRLSWSDWFITHKVVCLLKIVISHKVTLLMCSVLLMRQTATNKMATNAAVHCTFCTVCIYQWNSL